jgi:hypothetical protein
MQQRDPADDERVSRGPAEPDGGVPEAEVGPGGRGIDADEDLEQVDQQPGLDAPYGSQPGGQQPSSSNKHTPRSRPTGHGAF